MTEAFEQYHQPKPCTYCGGPAGYAPIPEMDHHGADVYFCQRCQAEYIYFRKTEFLANTSLYTKIGERTYRWSVARGVGQIWYIKTPGEPGVRRNEGMELVKAFLPNNGDVIPTLTPENINERLRTWLVFL